MPLTALSLVARKGGVGRTTLTMNLAGAFVQRDVRVLLIDADGQASLSRCLLGSDFVESLHPSNTLASLFQGRAPDVDDVVYSTPVDGVSLLPANDTLEEFARADIDQRQFAIAEFLTHASDAFDLVLIDTAPNINTLPTWSSVVASHYLISPVPCDAFGSQSIASVCRMVDTIQDTTTRPVTILGYVLNQLQRNAVNNAYRDRIRQLYGSQVFDVEIPSAAALRESTVARSPVTHLKPRTKATQTIRDFAQEIEARICALTEKRSAA